MPDPIKTPNVCPVCDSKLEKPIKDEGLPGIDPINGAVILPQLIEEKQDWYDVDCQSCGLFRITRHYAVNLKNDPTKESVAKQMALRSNKADRISLSTDSPYP